MRNFVGENEYDLNKVRSILCYSVQWDTALNFIDPEYTGLAKDSTGMGWYYDNYNSVTKGNIETNPSHVTGKDLIYSDNVKVQPASVRSGFNSADIADYIGFRIALYINDNILEEDPTNRR